MKIILLIIAFLFLALAVSALIGQTDYLHLPFSIEGAQYPVGAWLLVGTALFFTLSKKEKKEL